MLKMRSEMLKTRKKQNNETGENLPGNISWEFSEFQESGKFSGSREFYGIPGKVFENLMRLNL